NITLINGAAALGGAINNAENLLLNNVKLTNNTATVAGGAIYNNGGNIFINYSTIANNRSNGNGGAINSLKGNVEIYYSTLSHNQSRGNGGAINVENGSLSVNASTLSHNLAQGDGGAIAAYNSSLLSDSNTLAYNGAANGGAIYANGGKVTVFGNTIAFNHVAEFGSGSGLYIGDGTSYSVMRTLAVFNHANGSYGEDVYVTMRASGIIEDSIYIYLGDETPIGEDVEFFPGAYYLDSDIFTSEFLHDNGGWTQTLALAVNSLARDYGDPDNKSEVDEFDQRGYMRDGSYDIGAFEYAGAIGKVYSDANKSDNGTTIIYISSLEDLNDIKGNLDVYLFNTRILAEDIDLYLYTESKDKDGKLTNVARNINIYGANDGSTVISSGLQGYGFNFMGGVTTTTNDKGEVTGTQKVSGNVLMNRITVSDMVGGAIMTDAASIVSGSKINFVDGTIS
ncbi:MAG: choice-of-anchor Q domain-containing protein, partial [Victivallaceae bacterium]